MAAAETAVTASTVISLDIGTFMALLFGGIILLINAPMLWVLKGMVRDQKRLEQDNEKLDNRLTKEIDHVDQKHAAAIRYATERHVALKDMVQNDFARKDEVREMAGMLRGEIKKINSNIDRVFDKLDNKADKS